MTVQHDVLAALNLDRGSPPMTIGQFRRRIEAYLAREWPMLWREKDPDGYAAWRQGMMPTVAEAEAALVFNHRLAAYRAANARLARYRLAVGRPEITEEQETGDFDPATGEPLTETVVVQSAIEPLPAEIEQPVIDAETGKQTGTAMVPNPEIVRDDAERAVAQGTINGIAAVDPGVAAFET